MEPIRLYRHARLFFAGAMLALLGTAVASAQTVPFNFGLLVTAPGQQPATIPNNTTINLSAISNQVMVTAIYTGNSQATIPGPPSSWLLGSTEFTIAVPKGETFPLMLGPGQQLVFTIMYSAVSPAMASAQVTVPYTEPGATGPVRNAILLPLNGVSSQITLAYALQPNNNLIAIMSGDTIHFNATPLNTTATATLLIANSGSGTASITGITGPPATSPFQLSGLPLATPTTPYNLVPNTTSASLQIQIQYTPTAVETDTAQIMVTFQNGPTEVINISGSGATSTFTYSVVSGTTTTAVKAGETITLPSVPVPTGATITPPSSSVVVQVKNTGNANGVINSIAAVPDPPFAVSGQPMTPPTLKPGDSENFTVTFTPTTVGTVLGTLIVGNDQFKLSGTGGGSQLSFAYSSGGASVTIGQTGTVVFPNTQVSQSKTINFTVTNTGTTATTVSSVGTSVPFSVGNFSPTTLQASQSMTFPITFTPTVAGPANQILVVNGNPVNLQGVGTAPPNLPSYTISGPTGNVAPASQPNISLMLANAYPVTLNGILTLTTSGNFGNDPAVQFSSGGKTVPFVIPAGSTSANFAGEGSQIQVQTGTVAETVTLTPSFATTGGVDVTPGSPATAQFTIAALAPVLETLAVTNTSGSQTSASFTLLIAGYSTTRDLSSLVVTLTPAAGYNLTTSQITVDLSGASMVWFQSTASQAFGGTFQVSVPFTLTGTAPKNHTLLEALASVSATISNSIGASGSVQATF